MSDKVRVYISTISSNKQMSSNISRLEMVLKSKQIEYELVDVAQDHSLLAKMRDIVDNQTATPIQFVKGDTYLGDYSAFDDAVECGTLTEFCKC